MLNLNLFPVQPKSRRTVYYLGPGILQVGLTAYRHGDDYPDDCP